MMGVIIPLRCVMEWTAFRVDTPSTVGPAIAIASSIEPDEENARPNLKFRELSQETRLYIAISHESFHVSTSMVCPKYV